MAVFVHLLDSDKIISLQFLFFFFGGVFVFFLFENWFSQENFLQGQHLFFMRVTWDKEFNDLLFRLHNELVTWLRLQFFSLSCLL